MLVILHFVQLFKSQLRRKSVSKRAIRFVISAILALTFVIVNPLRVFAGWGEKPVGGIKSTAISMSSTALYKDGNPNKMEPIPSLYFKDVFFNDTVDYKPNHGGFINTLVKCPGKKERDMTDSDLGKKLGNVCQ